VTSSSPAGPLLDARGCLTAAGLAALERAAPGAAPAEVAAHVGGCARCQQRLLSSLRDPSSVAPASRRKSSGGRLVWVAVLAIGALFLLLAGLVVARSVAR
jgi:hypothetical protein